MNKTFDLYVGYNGERVVGITKFKENEILYFTERGVYNANAEAKVEKVKRRYRKKSESEGIK